MIQCFQMKTATVSDTKVSFSAPAERVASHEPPGRVAMR